MEIIPAIDIRAGQCVRLYQGDYAAETVYSYNPASKAHEWVSQGATRLHVVDLDGAACGRIVNLDIIREIARGLLVPVQVGGGVRSIDDIESLFKAGVDRVILGTSAVENHELVKEACHRFKDSIIVGIDAREGKVATRGWQHATEVTAVSLALDMVRLGVRRFIYTDISRDGTLTEPNFCAVYELLDSIRTPVIASGGVSRPIHLKVLKQLGVEGAIIGKALYTGDINLKQVLDNIG
ncbi:MAG: 1-(5-phosphoribosyl)-5-[(5-phosphoribosylamino)methylideneamino]imidazole-4-carboxamide isomerase [Dehalococcoidales bacterium]|nr:1-(5-phosphoribosyl)-5-[(5-phosphoribosylamino)methylideneamino]imidazole-4-carboxamide isomerase [Dehalococcoidales bacterium]MDD3264885.1 1-(5-phosphoribosyl)-5-[(5-phosphoribosylamino)methylideneamino]imidazole-4-carboxamide isomerase [Dehalococcoidales bacterium]MDD4794377.1 1-(5-phosphoribosyl)-5-[(5-phosphoribosylamino)methylideneamino]imidazole-4-carboxamide isomerase [Dehalococcoidales bacterium]MDD5122043.1 1-(5-phosphoribosyl)-5-[(5-phosphoribosylamino)methylideneamino]imidazole-4-c